ncbi:DUF4876 domain-containing protein [Riemerella columbina]|uniref:DUF4876 domain-containing protein n=1 Tax=Riemerella columbina TaxID=103810 RepID=UPI0003749949|nr:DUF4876 domain-containing protein [Riemerella columbina]
MKLLIKNSYLILMLLLLYNCSRDEGVVEQTTTEVKVTAAIKQETTTATIKYKTLTINFKELNTGKTFSKELNDTNTFNLTLDTGSYEISATGEAEVILNGNTVVSKVSGYKDSYPITSNTKTLDLDLFISPTQTDFVIEEVFFTGTLTPEGKQYNDDKYFKIYNNTDKILYADGLMISQSEFLTTDKQVYTPNIMDKAHAVTAIIMIPGNGTQYPVKPGEYILVADTAIDHKEFNPKSYDLRTADFEFYKEGMADIDNPNVPNTINVFSRMVMHNRGFTAYTISRLPQGMTVEQYLKDYKYHYKYDFVWNGVTYPMSGDAYSIPNEWIKDAVNLSVASEFQWLVTAPSIDRGWTYCGTKNSDKTRYGKSVIRKTLGFNQSGKKVLMDTNNSTVDFIPESKPSYDKN